MSNENTNGKDIADQSQARDRLDNHSSTPILTRNYELFDFEINQGIIEENKKINLNLVRHGQNINRNLLHLQGPREERGESKFTNSILNMGCPQ